MTEEIVVHEIQETGGAKRIWGLSMTPEALLFHPPAVAPAIPIPRHSIAESLRIMPTETVTLLTARLPGKVKFQLSLEVRVALEDWLRADWRKLLAGELKDESTSAMIFGAIWAGLALFEGLGAVLQTPDARLYMIFNAVFGGALFTLALLGRMVARPFTLLFFPMVWLCFGGWIGWQVATGRTHWAWLLLLFFLFLSMIYSVKKYSWFNQLAARFP